MSVELDLLQKMDKKLDKHTDAIGESGKQIAIMSTKLDSINEMGCPVGDKKNRRVHERIDNMKDAGKKYSIIGGVVAGAVSVIYLVVTYA